MRKSDEPAVSYPPFGAPAPSGLEPEALSAPLRGGEEAVIEISFPAAPTSLEILRSVIGQASRIAGFSYDGIEDFAMAVDEAATLLMESRPSDLVLTLSGMRPSGRLEVFVTAQDATKVLSTTELRAGYRWDVLQALCEEVWWEDVGVSIGLAQTTR